MTNERIEAVVGFRVVLGTVRVVRAQLTFHPSKFVEEQQQLTLHAREGELHQTVGVDVDQVGAGVGRGLVLFLLQDVGGRRRVGARREAQEPRVPVLVGGAAVEHHDGRRRFRGGAIGALRRRRRVRHDRGRGNGRLRYDHVCAARAPHRGGQQQKRQRRHVVRVVIDDDLFLPWTKTRADGCERAKRFCCELRGNKKQTNKQTK